MKNLVTLLLMIFILGMIPEMKAQNKKLKIDNVELSVVDNKVQVFYDIKNSKKDFHEVKLNFVNENFNPVLPYALSGDIGDSIAPGQDRMIIWDIGQDLPSLDSEIKPNVIVDGKQSLGFNGRGPQYALASLIVPGLGDYFVADLNDLKFKPYLRTASVYGFIALGFIANEKRWKEPDKVALYNVTGWRGSGSSEELWEERVYEVGKTHYWLFPGDSEIFFGAAAAIWIGDIIWVAARGKVNKKLKASLPDFTISQIPGGARFNLSYSF